MDMQGRHAINPWMFLGISPEQTQLGNMDRQRRMGLEMGDSPLTNLLPRTGVGAAQQSHEYNDTEVKKQQRERDLLAPARYYSQENRGA